MFARQAEPVVTKGQVSGRMRPVFKNLFFGKQLIELGSLVTRIAIPQGMVMGTLNDGDGIDLEI